MDLTEAIDVESIPDTQDASASDQAAQSSGKASSMYAVWDVLRTNEKVKRKIPDVPSGIIRYGEVKRQVPY